jgi:hypothetical protein
MADRICAGTVSSGGRGSSAVVSPDALAESALSTRTISIGTEKNALLFTYGEVHCIGGDRE